MSRFLRIASVVAATVFAAPVFAQTTDFWIAPSGNWSGPSNWSNGVPAGDGSTPLAFGGSSTWTSNLDPSGSPRSIL